MPTQPTLIPPSQEAMVELTPRRHKFYDFDPIHQENLQSDIINAQKSKQKIYSQRVLCFVFILGLESKIY
jgi:hypothetical protein